MFIKWSEDAKTDIKEISEYISYDSEYHANKFIERIFDKVENINLQPKVGRIVPEFENEIVREVF